MLKDFVHYNPVVAPKVKPPQEKSITSICVLVLISPHLEYVQHFQLQINVGDGRDIW